MNLRLVLCALLLPMQALACTLWGAAGDGALVTDGGTLLAKNRDWKPDHRQVLKAVRPQAGHAYFGLYAEGNANPGLKAGINDAGLSIVVASASSIPKALRDAQRGTQGVMVRVLAGYASVDAVLADADALFAVSRANFFLLADRTRLLVVEVGLDGKYVARRVDEGSATHTNHYLDAALAGRYGDTPGKSSRARLARIDALLGQAPRPLGVDAFVAMSQDRHAGPDDSLWRSGKEHTLAAWIVRTPQSGAPILDVRIANPGEDERRERLVLDAAFWRQSPGTVAR